MEQQQANAPPPVRNLVNFLRTKAGIKTKVGVLNGKRLDYFKGKSAIKALLSPAYGKLKDAPKVENEDQAQKVLLSIMPFTFFLLVDRGGPSGGANSPKVLQITQMQQFKADGYYAWFYEGSQWMTYAGGVGMVALLLIGVMFPLWPSFMRVGAWYLSMAVLGFLVALFALALVRLIVYILTIFTLPPGLWIFPQLFADVGFFESFVPLYEWDYPKKKKSKKGKGKEAEKEGGKKSKKSSKDKEEANGSASSTAVPSEALSPPNASSPAKRGGAFIEEVDE